MRGEAMRTALGLALIGIIGAGLLGAGCGSEQAEPAGEAPAAPAASPAPAVATPEPAEPLRRTEPDPEAVGVEGTLPDDVPTPQGAQALHAPMIASGATRASYEVGEPLAAVRDFYTSRLVEGGWSIDAQKDLEAQSLLSAKKGGRELSVAMSEAAGRTQLVLVLVGE